MRKPYLIVTVVPEVATSAVTTNSRSEPVDTLVTRLTAMTPAKLIMSPFLSVPVMALTTMEVPVWEPLFTVPPAEKDPEVWLMVVWSMNHSKFRASYILALRY